MHSLLRVLCLCAVGDITVCLDTLVAAKLHLLIILCVSREMFYFITLLAHSEDGFVLLLFSLQTDGKLLKALKVT